MPGVRRFPPAIFPSLLGVLGLVAAWSRAVVVFEWPTVLIDVVSAFVIAVFLGFAALYAFKVAMRPAVFLEDARLLPGRTGIAALALGCIVVALLASKVATVAATASLALGTSILLVLALWVLPRRLRGTDTAGPITPAMHLVFVGFILVPTAALPLGMMVPMMPWLVAYCFLAALLIIAPTIGSLVQATGPPPLRPLHAIQLAPPAFIATCLFLMEFESLGGLALIWTAAVAILLLVRLKWMMEGGFSPMWAAFTFPVTAFSGAFLLGGDALDSNLLTWLGGAVLFVATVYIPVIAAKIVRLWATGVLAEKTGAASA